MRKYLSALLALVVLLAALPLGVTAAAKPALNLMPDGDFESFYYTWSWSTYQKTYVGYDAALHGINGAYILGDGGWGSMLEQAAPVELGKAYRLEFWYKVMNNGFNWRLEQGWGCFDGLYETRWETSTEWTKVTFDFVATSPAVILNFCGSGNGIPEAACIDDVVLTPHPAYDFDGYVINGNFERGDLSGWTEYQGTEIAVAEEDMYGGYCAHLQGNGSWGAMLEQWIATKPGVEYTVMFRYKANQNGANLQIKNGYDEALASAWLSETEWTEGELTFVADDTWELLNICGGGNGISEDVYIDDVYVYVSGAGDPDDLVDDGQDAWMTYVDTMFSLDAAYAGGYGIHLQGDGSWDALAERTLSTVAGEEYTLSFWCKANNNGFNLTVRNTADWSVVQTGWYDAADWTYVEIPFTAPAGAVTLNFCGAGNGEIEDAYIDEVVLWSDVWEDTPDAAIRNGDFETGSWLGWSWYQNTILSNAAAYDGDYGALLMGDGGWGALLEQGFFTTGMQYQVSFRYKVLSEGFNLCLLDGDNGAKLAGEWCTSTEWEEVTLDFVSLSNTVRLNICGGGTGVPEVAYIDDITITCLDEEIVLPTMQDAALLQQYLNGWDVEPVYTDIDGDGEVNNKDLVILIRLLSGWYFEDLFPVE